MLISNIIMIYIMKLVCLDNESFDCKELYNTNYVLLPVEALEFYKNFELPYYFKLISPSGLSFYVGVKEFTAPTGQIIIPKWIMDNLCLDIADEVQLKIVKNVIKGDLIKLEPQDKSFFDIIDYDTLLTQIFSNYCLLQDNSIISVNIFDRIYQLRIFDISQDWSSIDIENNIDFPTDVIDIKNIDLKVDIINKFIKKEKTITKPTEIKKEEIKKLTKEELRNKRLAFFNKK